MAVELFRELVRFIAGLDPLQRELERLCEQRLLAIAGADDARLQIITTQEEELTQRMRLHLRRRSALLTQARQKGFAVPDLRGLLRHMERHISPGGDIDETQYRQAQQWMKRLDGQAWKTRRDSWAAWHALSRATRHQNEMRSLMASNGQSLNLEITEQRQSTCGGMILDAKV